MTVIKSSSFKPPSLPNINSFDMTCIFLTKTPVELKDNSST